MVVTTLDVVRNGRSVPLNVAGKFDPPGQLAAMQPRDYSLGTSRQRADGSLTSLYKLAGCQHLHRYLSALSLRSIEFQDCSRCMARDVPVRIPFYWSLLTFTRPTVIQLSLESLSRASR